MDLFTLMKNTGQLSAIKELVHALLEEVESLAEAQDPTPASADVGQEGPGFYQMIEAYEKFLIRRALAAARGQKAGAARLLRLKPTTLHYKMKAYDIKAGAEAAACNAGGAGGDHAEPRAQGAS
jgi:transcriptional regulator with GAF, ATPase, and Fis domain